MSSSRSEFLKSLTTRRQRRRSDRDLLWGRDIALREAARDARSRETPLEHIVEPDGERKRPREQVAGDQNDTAPAARAAQIEPQPNAGAELGVPVQPARQPSDKRVPLGSSPDHGNDLSHPSASWAEAGMPLRLRDAIASVRRISSQLYPGAPRDHETMAAPPFAGSGGDDEFLSDRDPSAGSSWDAGSRLHDHPADRHGQILADQNDSPPDEMLFGDDSIEDSLPTNDQLHEFGRAFQHEHIEPYDRATSQETTPATELAFEDDEHAQMLGAGAPYRDATKGAEAPRERLRSDDDEGDEEPSLGLPEELHDRLPARRGTTAGYGVHVTALAAAIVFVALAGFGFAMLSETVPPEGSPPSLSEQDTATAAPAPPSAQPGARPAPQPRAALDELATVRVAPRPGDALAEPASVAPARASPDTVAPTKALPLPPPPKPDLPQAATDQAPSDRPQATTDQAPSDSALRDAVDAAAPLLLAEAPADPATGAPSEAEGVGGPFEPLFAKLPASQATAGQVLVHYKANATGGPATAMHLVRELEAAGFSVEARPVPFPIADNSIRYFFPGDRDQAEALRASLEGQLPGDDALSVMDFSTLEPKPPEGHLEVWLRS
jgi:hypothetical protein